ncbi:hypothetical protein UVI_02036740 [Ustilaginoidea virens]|nr:hypothetical protein UVI_02036740 [Ustilaginoidea virens]
MHYHHTACSTQAIAREAALQLAQAPTGVERTIWLYELCRFLISQCNSLIVGFLFDNPPCSATTCPEMRASEWQFLCAVHEQPKSCCAIDYCCHTLDWAANVVSDQKLFPSRFAVVSDPQSRNAGVKSLVNVFRRLHRIFAHAWFQHRGVFWSVESQTGLYVLFKMVCDLYDLLPAENYKLPPEAEGLEAPPPEPGVEKPCAILKPSLQQRPAAAPEDDSLHPGGRTNTRRHIRSSPSTGSAVTTVMETDEEDTENVTSKMQNLHVFNLQEADVAEVPVVVDDSTISGASQESSRPGHPAEADETTVEPSPPPPSSIPALKEEEPAVVVVDTPHPDEMSDSTSAKDSAELPEASRPPHVDDPGQIVAESAMTPPPTLKSSEIKDEPVGIVNAEDMTEKSGQVTDPE